MNEHQGKGNCICFGRGFQKSMLVMSKLMFPSEKVAEKEFEFQKIVRIDEKRDMYLPS